MPIDIKIYQLKIIQERKKQFPTDSSVWPTSEDRIGFNDCSKNVLHFTVVNKAFVERTQRGRNPRQFHNNLARNATTKLRANTNDTYISQ